MFFSDQFLRGVLLFSFGGITAVAILVEKESGTEGRRQKMRSKIILSNSHCTR